MEIIDYVKLAKQAIEEKKGESCVILDISDLSPIADYFVIASCNNENQMKAVVDEVEDKLAQAGAGSLKVEGSEGSSWILMDYGDYMIHLFDKDAREFYNLDRVWQDAKVVN
ncbi:MAG: ribosome silencing factor [Lachnospiraceae bacterium]|nr:ribosome silencing factor [Lachnospiraceae bacterium]